MDAIAIIVGSAWVLVGTACIGLAVPLLQGKVKPNHLYGARFPESFLSDDAWFTINRYGAKRMILWAVPMIAVGIIAFFLPLQSRPWAALLFGLAPLAFILVPTVETWLFARRYAAQH
jgi:hypothetical protein